MVSFEVPPELDGTIYSVGVAGPVDSSGLTSEGFRQEVVRASGACDPNGVDSLSRRLGLTQSGKFTASSIEEATDEDAYMVRLTVRIASGRNTPQCANLAADSAVMLLQRSKALQSLRAIEKISKLRLTGTVVRRA